MNILSVIRIRDGIVSDVKSYDENAVNKAENEFEKQIVELGACEQNINDHIEDGYFMGGNYSVCLTWSEVVNNPFVPYIIK